VREQQREEKKKIEQSAKSESEVLHQAMMTAEEEQE
jgi:hypothetical protein